MTPTEHQFKRPDQPTIAYYRWGQKDRPTVLLVHATGFHARCWRVVAEELAADYHVLAVDQRGHGRSGNGGAHDWQAYCDDLVALADHLELSNAVGVGHSMGGFVTVYGAAHRPDAFRRLVLVDPVILDPDSYVHNRGQVYGSVEDHPVSRRRDQWRDWQEMYERFANRHPYSRWKPEILQDYCRYGVTARDDGDGYRLACPPFVEASIYQGNTLDDPHAAVAAVGQPVTVLRAPPRPPGRDPERLDFSLSPTWPELASRFEKGTDVLLPELTHFIPMEAPEVVVHHVKQALTAR